MKPVAKGTTKKFVRITDDKEASIRELMNSVSRDFTGRIQGVLKTSKGELEVVIEVLRGKIVAAGVDGYTRTDGGLALNTIINAIVEGTGFLEIIELNEEGVNLDLEFNPNSKLSMPASLELYISRIELRLRQLEKTRMKKKEETFTTTKIEKERKEKQTSPHGPEERRHHYAPPRAVEKPREPMMKKKQEEIGVREEPRTLREEHRESTEEKKKILEEIGLDEEVLEGLVVNVKDKPVVIEAIPSGGTTVTETRTPTIEKPMTAQPLIEEKTEATVTSTSSSTVRPAVITKHVETGPTPEELVSKLPLSDKIEDLSKTLLTEVDKLLVSLIETTNIMGHGRENVEKVFEKLINISKEIDEPVKLSTSTAGKLYYVIAHKGSIVSAFKIDESTENVELYGRAALLDLFKKLLSENIDYIISSVRDPYMLAGLGLVKKEEIEREVEERAEGLFSRLRKIFGGR